MRNSTIFCNTMLLVTSLLLFIAVAGSAQNFRMTPNDTLVSPRILPDNKVQFSIYAPEAKAVLLGGSDIPDLMQNNKLTKNADGVWTLQFGPVAPGAYRYNFNVDGLSVTDPRNTSISESNSNVWSLLYVPGADFMDTHKVRHGAIAEITYFSKTLNKFRRMHIYTPPGYEIGSEKYPVFYLLHGAGDCDDSWSTVGRAGFILDNLIAAQKAKPMIVVMPAGHTGPFLWGRRGSDGARPPVDEFLLDFTNDILPYTETHYRVLTDRQHRAIAGLSMGGSHTLNIAIPHMELFAWIGVYSSGIFGITGGNNQFGNAGQSWEDEHKQELSNTELIKGIKLFWFATGKDDFLVETTRATVDMFKKHGFNPVYKETTGAHTWINWQLYLNEFASLLFQ
ncbi:MAG TPA: alpha/beta hydrolase-fold protein [bacterium]|nr:alpha/beta hydrolase-fold protein [bacterium]HPN41970.1 alpha/beta hydrolase-fold protein [bacterium]